MYKPTEQEIKQATEFAAKYGWKVVYQESDKVIPVYNSNSKFVFTVSKPHGAYITMDTIGNKIAGAGSIEKVMKITMEQYYYCKQLC